MQFPYVCDHFAPLVILFITSPLPHIRVLAAKITFAEPVIKYVGMDERACC